MKKYSVEFRQIEMCRHTGKDIGRIKDMVEWDCRERGFLAVGIIL